MNKYFVGILNLLIVLPTKYTEVNDPECDRFVQLTYAKTVKPRLSGTHLSGNTAIQTGFLGNEKT